MLACLACLALWTSYGPPTGIERVEHTDGTLKVKVLDKVQPAFENGKWNDCKQDIQLELWSGHLVMPFLGWGEQPNLQDLHRWIVETNPGAALLSTSMVRRSGLADVEIPDLNLNNDFSLLEVSYSQYPTQVTGDWRIVDGVKVTEIARGAAGYDHDRDNEMHLVWKEFPAEPETSTTPLVVGTAAFLASLLVLIGLTRLPKPRVGHSAH